MVRVLTLLLSLALLNSCGGSSSSGGTCQRSCSNPFSIFVIGNVSRSECIDRRVNGGSVGICTWTFNGEDLSAYRFYYRDNDGDTFGNPLNSTINNSQPAGYVSNNNDCNDSDATINPNAVEIADGIDNDCNGIIDDNITYYLDSDGDTFGDPSVTQIASVQPSGYVLDNTDCDDSNSAINPVATEISDGIDNNCNGDIDEGFVAYYQDSDGDSFGDLNVVQFATAQPAGFVTNYADCDDTNAANFPGALELSDGVDNNCNGYVDETPGSIKINDTGILWGGNYPDGNNITCIGETIAQQDCSIGRDAEAAAASLVKIGDGHSGFDFTKLDSNGMPLADQTQDYLTQPWACVRDNHTGLVWETKTDDNGIHDKDNTYRWGGKTARLTKVFGDQYNDWNSLVDGSNNETLCGFSDWRIPSKEELHSIVNYDTIDPSIDTDYFPNVSSSGNWSASAVSDNSTRAWMVDLRFSNVLMIDRSTSLHVMLVRNEP